MKSKTVEIYNGMPNRNEKAERILQSMFDACPLDCTMSVGHHEFKNQSDILVLWGAGAKRHKEAWEAQARRGGVCIGFDNGYFERGRVRIHINSRHPTLKQVMMVPAEPRNGKTFVLRHDYDPKGPVMVVGFGNKSQHERGLQPGDWEIRKVKELQAEFGRGTKVWYRPKYRHGRFKTRIDMSPDCPIEEALKGHRLAVMAHSNVGVDCILAGVPARCENGIAKWFHDKGDYSDKARLAYLNRITWFEWRTEEAEQIWDFILGTMLKNTS